MSEDSKLIAAICITDPVREDAAATITQLRALGVKLHGYVDWRLRKRCGALLQLGLMTIAQILQ